MRRPAPESTATANGDAGPGGRISILQSAVLADIPQVAHGFSTRYGGVSRLDLSRRGRDAGRGELNLAEVGGDSPENVAANRSRFLRAWLSPARLEDVISLRQIHSTVIWRVDRRQRLPDDTAGDGLMTRTPGLWLTVRSADCVPILLANPHAPAVAAVHAGWRGTLGRIAEKAVGELRSAWRCRPADLRAAIGPCARACCYEVGEELLEAFQARFEYAKELFQPANPDALRLRYPNLFLTGAPPGHAGNPRWQAETQLCLDLAEANRRQLLDAGLRPENLEIMPGCTVCDDGQFFSFRRQGERAGRMWAIIGIRSKFQSYHQHTGR